MKALSAFRVREARGSGNNNHHHSPATRISRVWALLLTLVLCVAWLGPDTFAPITASSEPMITTRVWGTGPVLDQGQTPMCVAYSYTAWLQSEPNPIYTGYPSPEEMYHQAQVGGPQPGGWDGIPDDQPYDGTNNEGMDAYLHSIHMMGDMGGWTTDVKRARNFILNEGPIVVETPWTITMTMSTLNGGYVQYRPGDIAEGYHSWLIYGVDAPNAGDTPQDTFYAQNSWGMYWGDGGQFKITGADLQALMDGWGGSMIDLPHKPDFANMQPQPQPLHQLMALPHSQSQAPGYSHSHSHDTEIPHSYDLIMTLVEKLRVPNPHVVRAY